MDKTAVFVDDINDQSLLHRLLPNRTGLLFFRFNFLDAIEFNCNAIIVIHRAAKQSGFPRLPTKYNTSRLVVLSDCYQENTIVETLNAGAHHYIALQESEQVIKARMNAALRFHLKHERQILNIGPYSFNQDNRTAYFENRLINLSPREFELAYYLFSNRDRIVTDSELMTSVWTLPSSVDTRRIDTSICRIRKKMNLNTPFSPWNILRLRREGYQVTC